MSNISELANTPLDFKIGEKVYKIKRLSLNSIFAEFEKEIREDYFTNTREMLKVLEDKDKEIFFKTNKMPVGKVMDEKVQERLQSNSGGIKVLYKAFNLCQKVSQEEINAIIEDANNSDIISQIISYSIGNDIKDIKEDIITEAQKKIE